MVFNFEGKRTIGTESIIERQGGEMARIIKICGTAVVLVIVAITHFCFATNENKATAGIYKIEDVTLKFTPPRDWKQDELNPGALRFNLSDAELGSIAMLSIVAFSKNDFIKELYSEEVLKEMAATAKNDSNYKVISEEFISFAGTKALDLVTETAFETPIKLKIKSITFVKGNRPFQIQFTAEKEKFEVLLPAINEALKTLEVISQDSNITKPDIKEESSDYSLDLRNKFKSILEKMYLEILTIAKENNDDWLLNETPGASLQEKSQNAASDLLLKYKAAVEVPESEAREILSGKLDDSKNLADIKDCVAKFMEARLPIPVIIQNLLNKYQRHALSSLELELTARIFKEQLKQMAIPKQR